MLGGEMYPRVLSTHNLCIRPFTMIEGATVIPELFKHLNFDPYRIAGSKTWVENMINAYSSPDKHENFCVLELRKERTLVGVISFDTNLRVAIHDEYQGKGYAKEALISVIGNNNGFGRKGMLHSCVDVADLKSQHLVERYCMPITKEFKEDYVYYKI